MELAVASTIPTEQVRNAGAMNLLVERFRPPRHGHTVSSRGVLFARLQGTELQTLALKRTAWYPNSQVMRLEPILRKMTDALPGPWPSLSGSAGRCWSLSGAAGSHWSGLYVLLKVPAPLYAVCHGLRARGALLTDR